MTLEETKPANSRLSLMNLLALKIRKTARGIKLQCHKKQQLRTAPSSGQLKQKTLIASFNKIKKV